MSGATAQKIRKAGGNAKSGRGSEEGGKSVRVGQQMSPTLAPQQVALSPAKSASSQAPTTPSSVQETSSEGELSSNSCEGRNLGVETMNKTYPTMARSHPSYADWGNLISEENWVRPSLSSLKFSTSARGKQAPEQGSNNNNANIAMENAAIVAPALRTPGFSPSSGGREDQVSLAPALATPPPSASSQTRPCSRLVAAQITVESAEINITDFNGTTPSSHPFVSSMQTFRFASPIPCTITSTPHPTIENYQSMEWDQIPLSLGGGEAVRRSEFATAAFGRDPISTETQGIQTGPSLNSTPTKPSHQEASTSPINFPPGPASSIATISSMSKTSAMHYIDAAALRAGAHAALPCFPPLPKTANELVLDPVDATTTSESEGEFTGVVGEGGTIVHYIAGDLCLTGRGD